MAEPVASAGPAAPFRRLCLIGLGLIGGSVARAARERGLAACVVGCDLPPVLTRAASLDLVEEYEPDPARAVLEADCVMLCAPVGACAALAAQIAPRLAPGAILTDVGSTKASVLRDVGPHVPAGVHFIPGHPLAGTEFSGPEAGFAALFENRWCLLTPPPGADAGAVARMAAFWRGCGALVAEMDAARHDRVLALVSHLPHLIAFTICGTADALENESREQVLQFAASGFRDFTRIAASDRVMWRDIFLNNRNALLEMLERFSGDARAMAEAVRRGDAGYLEERIGLGRAVRRGLIERGQA